MRLLLLLLVVLGCSAADDDTEGVGQLEQALSPCSLSVTAPTVAGGQISWRVINGGNSPCGTGQAAYTELYKVCSTCGGSNQRTSYYLENITLAPFGQNGFKQYFSRPLPPCGSAETLRVLASWIPSPGAARVFVSAAAPVCPL